LLIYKLARPDDKTATLNVVLIFLLIVYNVTGGLLPDPNMPGSYFIQEAIAYGTGFIVPCYFPYYVYKAFGLEKMRFQAYKGVFFCLVLPYIAFVVVFAITNSLDDAKNLLILPVLYAIWVIYSLFKAIQFKYANNLQRKEAKEEITVLFLSLTPWIGLPVIAYFNLSQAIEASVTNTGFLLLLALQLKNHIKQIRIEHEKLIRSEKKLVNWNESLKKEVERRTKELEKLNEQKTNTFVNLAHETKTPLTLINNYLDEYISKKGSSEELNVVKKNIDKLSNDIVNFFDLEKLNKGFAIYNHDQVCNFSEILSDDLLLFKKYAKNRNIVLRESIKDDLFVQADPVAINRIIINLIENAIKFSDDDCGIEISLQDYGNKINFSVKDCGIGIPPEMQSKVFEPYYQITNQKKSIQGMGLGLPIVKKVVQDLNGEIKIESDPKREPGTKMIVTLNKHTLSENEIASGNYSRYSATAFIEDLNMEEQQFDEKKETILIVEDNVSMVNYLAKKLQDSYNVYTALNGNEALKKLKTLIVIPDLIISDVMMDKVDGYAFAKIISNDPLYNHIPFMFLSAKAAKSDKLQGLRLGAIDYVHKPFSINVLKQKIESILQNAKRQRSAVFNKALNVLNKPEPIAAQQTTNKFEQNCELYHLTAREKDIAKLVCKGRRYKEIGETLFIAERTVTKHVQNIFEKVRVTNKIELINKLDG
jgi:signal transduction histidine kinase/DNA-binding NarL/FixJ family response regulator